MRSALLLLCALALPYASSHPTTKDSDDESNRPNFTGAHPEVVDITKRLPQIGGNNGNPPNCGVGMVRETNIVGDGAKKEWTFWKQISSPIYCNKDDCVVGFSQSKSYTIGFSASGPINRWITGGFNVDSSYSTGNNYECSGNPGDKVCVWSGKHHWAYSVKNVDYPMDPRCGRLTEGPTVRVTSPLKGEAGQFYWCGKNNDCHDAGHTQWTEGFHHN